MNNHSPSIAKLTMPRVAGTAPRHRLLQRLDDICEQYPVLWLSSPGGSGKTILIGSWLQERKVPCLWFQMDAADTDPSSFFYYLGLAVAQAAPRFRKPMPLFTPEYQASLPLFTRRFFEEMGRRLPPSTVMVFDNCETIDENVELLQLLANGIESLPREIETVFLSRHELPTVFARFRLNGRMATLDWDELKTSVPEAEEIALLHDCSAEEAGQLAERSGGWLAALILMLEQRRLGGNTAIPAQDAAPQALFDFFSNEIFATMPEEMRGVLLKTAFLPDIHIYAAVQLSSSADAGRILAALRRRNFFTERLTGRGDTYRYHPLFKRFLLDRAKELFDAAEIARIQAQSAHLLAEAGQLEDAAELYLDAAHWDEAGRLILEQATALVSQGRGKVLEEWLRRLPQEYIRESPWVLYWFGICRMPYDPMESRGYFENAFNLFRVTKNINGVFLAWASIVDTFIYQWSDFSPLDDWIVAIEDLLLEYPEFPSREIEARVAAGMLNALNWRQPYREDLSLWAERVWQITLTHPSTPLRIQLGSYLIIYYLWVGDFSRSTVLIDTLRPVVNANENAPLTQQHWHAMEAMSAWYMADSKACMDAVRKGLKNAEDSGVHLLDLYILGQGVYSGVSLGELSTAVACLEKMSLIDSGGLMEKSFYQYQASSVAWCHGDLKKAIVHGRLSVQFGEASGCQLSHALCRIELALTLFDDNQHDEAHDHLIRSREIGQGMSMIEFMCDLQAARFAFEQGHDEQGLVFLQRGMARGARQGYVNFPRWSDHTMSRLCAKALTHDIEPEYVHGLILKRSLLPPVDTLNATASNDPHAAVSMVAGYGDDLETWPWPVKLRVLCCLELYVAGKQPDQGKRSQQKPLTLLKVLASFGPAGVSTVRLATLLWPDSDGDKAHHALEMAIHRARKLLGREDALLIGQGQVRFNEAICWVDSHAFAARIDAVAGAGAAACAALERTLLLYRGHFLDNGDDEEPWVLAARSRLRVKFLIAVEKLCDLYEAAGEHEKALDLCRRSAEVDELSEEIYLRYIRCCLHLGRQIEAAEAFCRLDRAMKHTLGVAPSSKLAELLQEPAPIQ